MRKYMLVAVAVVAAFIGGVIPTASAQAPEEYTAEYNATNFYSTDGVLQYYFTGLDVNTTYSWLLQAINSDGSTGVSFTTQSSLGVANKAIQWSGADGEFDLPNGLTYSGALRVIDIYGQVLGKHYTLPGCNVVTSLACGEVGDTAYDWLNNGAAVNPAGARFGFGGLGWQNQGENSSGYFHTTAFPSYVTTQRGNVTFLHYSSFLSPNTDKYKLYFLDTGLVAAQYRIQDLVDYNTDIRAAFLAPYFVTQSFVVVNTDGEFLPYINDVQNDAAFNKVGAGDNPHELNIVPGAYDYVQSDNVDVWQNDGESVLLISNISNNEWGIKNSQNSVGESGSLRIELESSTEGIYDSGYSDHNLIDSSLGAIDAADYAFQRRRHYAYTVAGVAQPGLVATWEIYPALLNQVAALTTRGFSVDLIYDISIDLAVSDRVESTLAGFGMDTPLGRGLGMLLLMSVGMLFLAKNGARTIIPFGLTYLVVGGGWLALGMGDTITTVLFGITAIFVIFIMINTRSSVGSSEG